MPLFPDERLSINVDGIRIYIKRKPIKNAYLRIDNVLKEVTISVPWHFGEGQIREIVSPKLDWIRRQLAKTPQAKEPEPFPPASQTIWGVPIYLKIDENARDYGIKLNDAELIVASPGPLCPAIWVQMRSWLLRQLVMQSAPSKIEEWRTKLGLPTISFAVRRMKNRWGTCYPAKRRIIINSEIATKPKACFEEVIVHELIHFFEPNHGLEFKRRLAECLPDWQARAELLK